MGTSGPGNITHIDNLYVKTFDVQDNVNIVLGEFVVVEASGVRPLVISDITGGNGNLVDLTAVNVVQAGEFANNLTTTDALLRKNQIECITKGSDWVVTMAAGVLPDSTVGIVQINAIPFLVNIVATVDPTEILGAYKHKEFSTVAKPSLLDDNGIISTGRHI